MNECWHQLSNIEESIDDFGCLATKGFFFNDLFCSLALQEYPLCCF